MACCGGGRVPPAGDPVAICGDERREFKGDAWIMVHKHGLDPCSVQGTGFEGLVLRQDVLRALGR